MRRLSLTARLSLLFMLAVAGVLAGSGFFFNHLSQHHFDELDQQTLSVAAAAAERLLREAPPASRDGQLRALFSGQADLQARIRLPVSRSA
ncbi:hypothetical protein [Pseudomonas sp. RL]|uniref:hypothetical protein n=1 Tax=Pseudomonas sp. RL TaxID=1452718 RepID=UPI0004879BD5|nr:hypothetical protein [Pseudomonas sp. RL]